MVVQILLMIMSFFSLICVFLSLGVEDKEALFI